MNFNVIRIRQENVNIWVFDKTIIRATLIRHFVSSELNSNFKIKEKKGKNSKHSIVLQAFCFKRM